MTKTTLRFHRTHGTHGSSLIKAYGLLQWRIQTETSQERWHNRTESKRDHAASFQLPPATPLQPDFDMWQCASSIANREPHASLGVVQVFWVSVTQIRGTHVTNLLLPSFSKCQTGIESISLPISQYSINRNCSAQHKAPGKQSHSYLARPSKSLEVSIQERKTKPLYVYLPSFLSLPALLPSRCSRSSQSSRLGSLCNTATSHCLFCTWQCTHVSATFSVCPILTSPVCVQVRSLLGSSEPFF